MPRKSSKSQTQKLKPALPSSLTQPTGSSSGGAGTPERSVNDLIQHLRRTQVAGSPTRHHNDYGSKVAARSVHPSIRNLLELPETPPPRPRHGFRNQVGERRIRRTPGPAAPASWSSPSARTETLSSSDKSLAAVIARRHGSRPQLRLDRLPGATLPRPNSLLHTVLKAMALRWDWHLVYDGEFLAEIPVHLKLILLSYIAVYTEHEMMGLHMQGFKPLFMPPEGAEGGGVEPQQTDVTRLDLTRALGYWISLRQLNRELKGENHALHGKSAPPSSWEEEEVEEEGTAAVAQPSSSLSPQSAPSTPGRSLPPLRFRNLQFLFLAHPAPGAANWDTLLSLLSNLATLTHLSLAHWPVPTLKPNSLRARVRHPHVRSLSFAYGGTDIYSAYENNWAEAGTILAKLSRTTYCLKWLDLAGCNDWIPALCWDGVDIYGTLHQASGPEWNGSWRGVGWLGIEPGWVPETGTDGWSSSGEEERELSGLEAEGRMEEHRQTKQREAYAKCIETAKDVQTRVRTIRRNGGGKWLDVAVGSEVPWI